MTRSAPTTGLLLMDLQRSIVDGLAIDTAVLRRANEAAQTARAADVLVVHVTAAFRPGHPEVSPANRRFAAIKEAGALRTDQPATSVHPAIDVRPDDVLVTKKRVSAFSGSDLEVVLRAQGVESLVLAGLSTSGVVLSTVRAAADMDYRITVLTDCCADPDPELHRILVERVFPVQADVTTAELWRNSLSGRCGVRP